MANGITARQVDAVALKSPSVALGTPVYLGQAPIWQIDSDDWKNLAGTTVLAKTLSDVKNLIGYIKPVDGKWDKSASLSMVAYYHMVVEKIAPIILIVNSAVPVENAAVEEDVIFIKGVAKISNPYVVLSSVVLDGLVKGTDYTVAYDADGQNVLITALTEVASSKASYTTVKADSISFSADTYNEVEFIPQNTGFRPTTIAAPLWDMEVDSKGSKVLTRISELAESVVDKHWFMQAYGNLDDTSREEALVTKEDFGSYKLKLCFPYVMIGSCIFPVSLVTCARRQTIDTRNDGVPFESASNEAVEIVKLCDKDGNLIKQLESQADVLNASGIATMAFTTAMGWRTWGVCMANYSEAGKGNIAPNKPSDVNVQMMDYICNEFEIRYGDIVHKPMSIRVVNDIINDFTGFVRMLVSQGRLINGSIAFEQSLNSTAELADGQFTYSIEETNTPAAKAIIAEVTYDSESLDNFFSDMGGEE